MMLVKVDVINQRGNILTLEMAESESLYQVNEIDGLNPVKAELVSVSYAGAPGEQFQSARRGPRDITFKLSLDPDFVGDTITSLRNDLYSYFLPTSKIDMRFHLSNGLMLDISGIVEDFSSPQFAQDPDVTVSVRCFNPDFVDTRIISLTGATVDDNTNTLITYPGTVDSGVVLTMNFIRTVTAFSMYNRGENGVLQQLDFNGTLIPDDTLVISSLQGSKGITLTRSGVSSSYLYGRTAQSSWISLTEGVNEFRVFANGDPIDYELEYVVKYGAI